MASPRLLTRLLASERMTLGPVIWRDTSIRMPEKSPAKWRNIFTNEVVTSSHGAVAVSAVFANFPVAILSSEV